VAYCKELNAQNLKFPPWKTLQGLLWRQLFQDGTVEAPLFDDVLPALEALKNAKMKIYIYSSGSIEAQKLLLGHSNHGDIRSLIDGCTSIFCSVFDVVDYDPSFLNVENKFDSRGYESIISQTGIQRWTFFSDIPGEVAGAKLAGMQGYVVIREGNKPLTDSEIAAHKILDDGFGNILDLVH
jgi:enolase-phosphatase E1